MVAKEQGSKRSKETVETLSREDNQQSMSFQEKKDRVMQAIAFAEAGQPEMAKEILGLKPSLASTVYGDVVYWGTVGAAVVAMVGLVITFLSKANFISPSYLLSAIWKNSTVEEIWNGAVGSLPKGHWYLAHLTTGDGMTEFGIAIGVFIVIPAMVASGLILYKQRKIFFGTLALIAGAITISSMLGLIPLPVA